jgi:hypothetical protein
MNKFLYEIFMLKDNKKIKINSKGNALLMSLFILTGVLVVSLGAANLVSLGIKTHRTQQASAKAYFAAESGIERLLFEIRKNGMDISACDGSTNRYVDFTTQTCVGSENIYSLSNGSEYSVVFVSNSPITFRSSGSFLGTERTVEVNFTN